jgi:hypothetical protein
MTMIIVGIDVVAHNINHGHFFNVGKGYKLPYVPQSLSLHVWALLFGQVVYLVIDYKWVCHYR